MTCRFTNTCTAEVLLPALPPAAAVGLAGCATRQQAHPKGLLAARGLPSDHLLAALLPVEVPTHLSGHDPGWSGLGAAERDAPWDVSLIFALLGSFLRGTGALKGEDMTGNAWKSSSFEDFAGGWRDEVGLPSTESES